MDYKAAYEPSDDDMRQLLTKVIVTKNSKEKLYGSNCSLNDSLNSSSSNNHYNSCTAIAGSKHSDLCRQLDEEISSQTFSESCRSSLTHQSIKPHRAQSFRHRPQCDITPEDAADDDTNSPLLLDCNNLLPSRRSPRNLSRSKLFYSPTIRETATHQFSRKYSVVVRRPSSIIQAGRVKGRKMTNSMNASHGHAKQHLIGKGARSRSYSLQPGIFIDNDHRFDPPQISDKCVYLVESGAKCGRRVSESPLIFKDGDIARMSKKRYSKHWTVQEQPHAVVGRQRASKSITGLTAFAWPHHAKAITQLSSATCYGSTELVPGSVMGDLSTTYWDYDSPTGDSVAWSFGEEYENVTLMYAKHEKIPMKDYGSEIRATMDIDHLLNKAVLLLDLPETSLEEIFNKIIHEMDIQEPEFTADQVKSALFTQDTGNQFHILSRTVQSICTANLGGGTFDFDQTWICAICMLPTVQHRYVAIARLSHPTNLGRTMQDLRFIIIVIAPSRAKGTKTALETARTFATLFADMDIRQRLVMAPGVDSFRHIMLSAAKDLALEQNNLRERKFSLHLADAKEKLCRFSHQVGPNRWYLGRGLKDDFYRRLKFYISDYLDGVRGPKSIQKLLSTVVFLYFACILPSIAFGVVNHDTTKGAFGVKQAVFAQAFGGIFFAIFGGQAMIILVTTVPVAIYVKIIFIISGDLNNNYHDPKQFLAMYACVGLWAQFFVVFYSFVELSNIMKFATRSTEEIFSLFMALAFIVEAFKALNADFSKYYHSPACDNRSNNSFIKNSHRNATVNHRQLLDKDRPTCNRETSILYILLMFGTLWLAVFLYNFRKTPFLTRAKRELLADFALPVAVIVMSFTGAYCFSDVHQDKFNYTKTGPIGTLTSISSLPTSQVFLCMGLGFCLSFLFFMDQNITSSIVNNPQNKLKKGVTTHLDLLVVGFLNIALSLYGLPWMYAALPHSPLHLRALADVEERVAQGHVHEVITNVRETRLASLIAHILILISALVLLPEPLIYIPRSVLDGLFLYMAVTSVAGNEMFERILLLFTEQAAYPPTHYIRRVPQRKVHLFTICQLIQLFILCSFGFAPYPYIEMVFPVVCFCFLPVRHLLIPRLIDYRYLDALDGRH